jgi:hypothetical protein
MSTPIETITKHYSITNTTDKHLLVGNCHHVIAAYESRQEAVADMDNVVPSIEDSPWASVRIVPPGETVAADYCQSVPLTQKEQAQRDAEWEKELAKLPWMIPS